MMNLVICVLLLSGLARGQDLRRRRKQRYIIPQSDPQTAEIKLENESDRLRQEVREKQDFVFIQFHYLNIVSGC